MSSQKQRVAIVTGSAKGVGKGIAGALAAEGHNVVIAARSTEVGNATAAEITARGCGRAIFVHCDVTVPASIENCVSTVKDEFNSIDILVNNAVYNYSPSAFEEHSEEDMLGSIDVALLGTFRFMRACFPFMKAQHWGRVINLGSMSGYEGWENWAAYAAVKESVRALTKVAAREWGKFGITVNTVCPFADSEGWLWYQEQCPEEAQAQLKRTPMRRVGSCENDVGRVVTFLCSDAAEFITGHTLPVDGGAGIIA